MILEYIDAGEIVTTHGVRGEIKILTWLDSPEMLCEFERCRIDKTNYTIESCRVQKTCNLIKLRGIDTVDAAQSLRGKVIQLYRQDVSGDIIFAAELIGVDVFSSNGHIGKITDVLDYPGNSVYVVSGPKKNDQYLIPAVKEFILSTDLNKNEMHVKLIEGMRVDEN